ncbi:divergent polysaccharide deacetylase family protein [Tateyamaria sp.]|uniref:divergent polysaccharide deacteylase family protein n=1 Tax=Tateyamaria sp. TaxID=1929288 RepID=UPI00329E32BF
MARGFLSGIIWGSVVSVIGAGTASVIADGPKNPEAEVQAPSGAAAPEAGEATTAAAVSDADIARASDAQPVTALEADTVAAADAAGADTPTVPQAGGADDLADPAATSQSGGVTVGDVTPVAPSAQSQAPSAPLEETELSISTVPAQPAAPAVTDTPGAFVADTSEDAPALPIGEAPAPDTPAVGQGPEIADLPEAPRADTPVAAPEVTETETPEPDVVEPEAPVADVETAEAPEVTEEEGALDTDAPAQEPAQEDVQIAGLPNAQEPSAEARPRIGRPGVSLVDRNTPDDAASPEAEAEPSDSSETDARAIVAHAAPFDNPDDKPLMAIVLIDSGIDLTGGPVGLAALRSFPYPLTFAVDASLSDANTRMADYRAEGFEVMALLDLPQGATPVDAEVSLSVAIDVVPEAVAIMEGTGNGVQETRETGDQIAQAVLATGHGLVLQSKGLNTTQKLAAREGVPAGLVFRDFDSADQTPTVIRRFLDQAAFRAGQEGGVIMVGRVRPDTISALLLWGLQDRAERVALAPISAVLTELVAPQ